MVIVLMSTSFPTVELPKSSSSPSNGVSTTTDEQGEVRDYIEFSESLDLTRYLSAQRQKDGERALYRLSAIMYALS
jgi:hypothetical protein